MIGKKVKNVRVFPVTVKIAITFTLFILISNFTTNYINLIFNRNELYKLMNELLTKDLKNIYTYCGNQYEIYQYDQNIEGSVESIEKMGRSTLKTDKGIIIGVQPDGKMLFQASSIPKVEKFADTESLNWLKNRLKENKDEGAIYFNFNDENYFGMYKFNPRWDAYIVRAEELGEFNSNSWRILFIVGIIIVVITIIMAVIGNFILRFILRYIEVMTSTIMKMIKSQDLGIIDMRGAPSDDITYLGTAFNSLSSMVGNLIGIFRKFANQDIVHKAYRERQIKLEGEKKELTILFSDIKSFTYITETLGTDIIKLLNLHYDRAIREIVKFDGVIGSIIGDALLAVFGAMEESTNNKSYQAIMAGYKVQEVTQDLRERMRKIKNDMQAKKGGLTKEEAMVYKAVLLEIGVGIDGGEVFYGT
ncbi:MAG: adenylate/guanylate cyclase domain-containing protein, partial [Spirochaetes bacterium]|nr:adenylate/guanylate cyclase domain-containing protein [Spirochaetota bacterium]